MTTATTYRNRRKDEHRAWLEERKANGCERCGEHRSHLLTIIDPVTGKGAGVGADRWWISPKERDRRAVGTLVYCQTCGHAYRKERRNHAKESQDKRDV